MKETSQPTPDQPVRPPRPRRVRLPAAARKAQILAAARVAIEARGYPRATVEAIAREAGISKVTFFRHFPSKADLRRGLIEAGTDPALLPETGGKQIITAAAGRLFAAQGYAGTTIAEIARAAGVSKAAVYWHFRDKEELLEEAFRAHAPPGAVGQTVQAMRDDEPEVVLRHVCRIYLESLRGLLVQFRIVLSEMDRFPRFRRFLNSYMAEDLVGLLARYLDYQVKAGRLALDDPCLAAQALYGMVMSFVIARDILQRDDLVQVDDDEILDVATRLFLNGARPQRALPRVSASSFTHDS